MAPAADDALLQPAADGSLESVEAALGQGASINARGEFGDSALNVAVRQGHKDLVQRLLDRGADLENVGGADQTPLMNAAFAGNIGIVRLLLAKGAKVTNGLLTSVQMKVNILEENAESGMVRPDAVEAWKQFLQFLIDAQAKAEA